MLFLKKKTSVILLNSYIEIGKIGDVLQVSKGYAKNFLVKKNICAYNSTDIVSQIKEKIKQFVTNDLIYKDKLQQITYFIEYGINGVAVIAQKNNYDFLYQRLTTQALNKAFLKIIELPKFSFSKESFEKILSQDCQTSLDGRSQVTQSGLFQISGMFTTIKKIVNKPLYIESSLKNLQKIWPNVNFKDNKLIILNF